MKTEKESKQWWIDEMIKELDTEEKLREELGVYYEYMQKLQKLIYKLSDGLLSKPNYTYDVYMEFLEKYVNSSKDGETQ